MSDRQLRTSSTTSNVPSRRPRKPTLRNVDDDKQRERKRALDRKAQRASREKTRSHMAHLEKMVKILSEKDVTSTTGELLEEMSRLHAEIDRLRKIIDGIKSALGPYFSEQAVSRLATQTTCNEPPDSPDLEMQLCEANSSSDDGNQPALEDWASTLQASGGDFHGYVALNTEVGDGLLETATETNSVRNTLDSTASLDKASVDMTSRWEETKTLIFKEEAPSRGLPSPAKTSPSTPSPSDFPQCRFWKKANAIYGRIFHYDKEGISAANNADSGVLFKAVKEGWGALTPKERANPVVQILEEVDQNLFWDLDPVTKVANLHKSHHLLKYHFNAERRNLERIPPWQRPVHSQRTTKHPLPIDFFPWPALRDRLVRHHRHYFATSDFGVNYRQNFKFNWPFGFDETYQYSPSTGTYRISPLFERYCSNERSWTLNKAFFEKYPEYIGEISVHRDMKSPPLSDVQLADAPETSVTSQNAESSGNFEDECIMALFDEIPPT